MKSYTGEQEFTQQDLALGNLEQDLEQNYNLEDEHQAKTQEFESQANMERFMQSIQGATSVEEPAQQEPEIASEGLSEVTADETLMEGEGGVAQGQEHLAQLRAGVRERAESGEGITAKDVATGIIKAPRQIGRGAVSGVIQAVNETISMAEDLGELLNVGGVAWGDDGIRLVSSGELSRIGSSKIPNLERSGSTVEDFARNMSAFVTGFVGAGKILKPIQATTRAGRYGKVMAQGAAADFSVFDPVEGRLSDMLQESPTLRNPVSEFLQTKEDDTRIEGRIKNAVEGLGLGVAFDGFMKALRGIKMVRNGRIEQAAGTERHHFTISEEEMRAAVDGLEPQRRLALDEAAKEGKNIVVDDSEVYVNWSRMDSPEDVKNVMKDMIELNKASINDARRGKVTFEQTKLNAESEDAWEILKSRNKGQPLNDQQSLAARELWARSGDRVSQLSEIAAKNPSDTNLFALKKMMTVHHEIQQNVIAARTEIARSMSSWRIPTSGTVFADDLFDMVTKGGGRDEIKMMAERITLLAKNGQVKEMDEFIRSSFLHKSGAAVAQSWRAGLLSSPHTHMRNAISQTAILGQQMYERKAANLMGQIFGYQSSIPDGEIMSMTHGMLEGIKEAFQVSAKGRAVLKTAAKERLAGNKDAAMDAIRDSEGLGNVYKNALTGESGFYGSKVEGQTAGALSAETWGKSNDSFIGKGLNMIDTVTTVPYRALSVADEAFKTTSYRMELNARSHRMASNELASGKITQGEFRDRIVDLKTNPTDEMIADLHQFAKEMTFQEMPIETGMRKAWNAIANIPVLGKIVLPFNKTPYNIAVYGFERTPFAPLVARWREDFAAGGMRREMATTKMATGTLTLMVMADLAMDGKITGSGPKNPGQVQNQRRRGIQSNSVKIDFGDGERYYSYRGIDPISTPLGLAAEVVDILVNTDVDDEDIEVEQLIIATTMAIANQVTSQQYMSGVSNFFDMMSEPQRYGQGWFNQLAGTVVPGGAVTMATRQKDPYARAAYDMASSIKARTYGLSEDLPMRRDLWGGEIDYRSGLGSLYDMIVPMKSSKYDATPIDVELDKQEIWIGGVPKRLNFDGVSINMKKHPFAYERMQLLAGNEMTHNKWGVPVDPTNPKGLRDTLSDLVTGKHPLSVEYNMRTDGSDGGKADMIRSYVSKYREAARQIILDEYPELKAEYEIKQSKRDVKYNFMERM